MKGHGYSNDLLEACIRDAKEQGKKGICILCAEGRKREFLADPKFLTYKGFCTADISDCGINLMYLPIESGTQPPHFKECAKHPVIKEASPFRISNAYTPLPWGTSMALPILTTGFSISVCKVVLFSITPISVHIPIIGCQGCRRRRRSMVSCSRLPILLTKNLHRMYLHRSRPMPCFGTVSF